LPTTRPTASVEAAESHAHISTWLCGRGVRSFLARRDRPILRKWCAASRRMEDLAGHAQQTPSCMPGAPTPPPSPNRRKRRRKGPAVVALLAVRVTSLDHRRQLAPAGTRRVSDDGVRAIVQPRIPGNVPRVNAWEPPVTAFALDEERRDHAAALSSRSGMCALSSVVRHCTHRPTFDGDGSRRSFAMMASAACIAQPPQAPARSPTATSS
jgi:hypothetical protein